MNVSTSITPSPTPPTRWPLAARSSSPHVSRARELASKRMASASLPSTSPNSNFSRLLRECIRENLWEGQVGHSRHFHHPFPNFPFHFHSRTCYPFPRNVVNHRQANYVQVVHVDDLDYD